MTNAELYRLVKDIVTGAEAAMARWLDPPAWDGPVEPDDPSEPIRLNLAEVDGYNAGQILAEAAIEELRDIEPRLLFSQPLEWQEINRLIHAIRTLVLYLGVPPIVYDELRREVRGEQAALAREARQQQPRPPSVRERAFLSAVNEARERGTAVADLRTRDLWEPAQSHMPSGETIARQTIDGFLRAYKRSSPP